MSTKRPCRYGAACRNPTCAFSHDATTATQPSQSSYGVSPSPYGGSSSSYGGSTPSYGGGSSSQACRYGTACKRADCRFSHQPSNNAAPYQSTSSYSSPSLVPCRFGANCTAPNCRFFHDDDDEFSPEEEERMEEILDMIEQEQQQLANDIGYVDEEDDKNIDEILAFMQNQKSSNTHDDEFSLPEGADEEFDQMVQQQQQTPFYGDTKTNRCKRE